MDGITAMILDKNILQEEIANLIRAFENKHRVPQIENIRLHYIETTQVGDACPHYELLDVKVTVSL